jgi:peptide/nickel transport system substrate-binding protein
MRTRLLVAGLGAAMLLLAACKGTAPAGSASSAPTNATFTYANNLEVMIGWDPATDYSNEGIAMNNIYEQLTRYDITTKKVVPLLAKSWTHSNDGLTWTFTLQDGVTFSNGHACDAAAAKAAIDRTIKLAGGASYEWDAVKSIQATDATTLVFHLKYAAPLDLIASSGYGAFIYDTKAASGDLAKWFEEGHTAGTGPYVVDSYNKGQEVELRLKANPTYWRGWDGSHYQQLVFRVVPQETTAAQLLQSGEVDFVPALSPSLFASVKAAPGVATSTRSSFENILAMLNTASGPLANEKVRQAVQEAIDYDGIVTAQKGALVKANGVIPDGLLGFDGSITPTYDPTAAQQLLNEAGYGPGGNHLSLTLTYASGTPQLDTIVTLMKSNLAKVGIALNAKALAWNTQWSIAKSSDPTKRQDIFLFYWYPDYADPYSWFINLYHSANPPYFNLSYWDDPAVDKQIDQLQSLTATNPTAAATSYQQLQRTISDQAISPVLGVVNFQRAYTTSFTGYVDNPSYTNVVFAYDLAPTG